MIAHTGPVQHVAVVIVAGLAMWAHAAAWSRSEARAWWRPVCWGGGVLVVLVATAPFTERWAAATFTGHMGQHLLLMVVAPPLLVVARPIATIGHLLPPLRPVHRAVSGRWRRWSPILAPACFLVVLFGTHLTGVYDAALGDRLVHDAEHLAYLGGAVGLWGVVLAPVTTRALARVASAFAVIGGSAVLGIVLTSADRPLVNTYERLLGAEAALADQRDAAALMWVGGMALGLPLVMLAVWRWAAAEQRTTERAEQLREPPQVAAGAAATHADAGDELRGRHRLEPAVEPGSARRGV